jgi:tRNA dimethylallyltransferase
MYLPQVARMALRPVITVCGPTGVGKSKLGVALALKLSEKLNHHGWKGGVVINADVMQVYKGFPIITNKMTIQEREGVEHLLMDFKEPTDPYVVGQWINDATRAVSSSRYHLG